MKLKLLILNAVLAAIYVILTLFNPVSYGFIQFRFSEIIAVIPFFDRRYLYGAVIGVVIANMQSPLGLTDVLVGASISVIAYSVSKHIPNPYFNAVLYSLLCALLVGGELFYLAGMPFWLSALSVGASQLLITLTACTVIKKIKGKKNYFLYE